MTTRPKPKLSAPSRAHARAARPAVPAEKTRRGERDPDGVASTARKAADAAPPTATLRLAIGKSGVGLELEGTTTVGCARIAALTTTFRGVKFPVDVSGGVTKFRHRRGELQRIEVEIAARSLERWMAPRLAGLLSTRTPDVWVAVGEGVATVCVSIEQDAERDRAHEPRPAPPPDGAPRRSKDAAPVVSSVASPVAPALAFDVHAVFDGETATLIVANARGANLPGTATAIALGAIEGLAGEHAARSGSLFVVRNAARALVASFLPEAGARIPSTDGIAWNVSALDGDTWFLQAERGAIPSPPTDAAVRARATAVLLREGDDALLAEDVDRARAAFLSALERAPRHEDVVRRIVEVDARTPGREEALLAVVGESVGPAHARSTSGLAMGTVRGELLAAIGDVASAIAHLEHAAHSEPAPALASRAFEYAASLAGDPGLAAHWLDHALARWPRSIGARWSRVRARLQLGRLEEAIADVAHLEALARGGRAKHAVWVRAGRAFQEAGLGSRARAIFERALRYEPDDAHALAGLGEALVSEGAGARGVVVLTRALGLLEKRGESPSALLLVLARAFAEHLDDRPTAIAHAAEIVPEAPEAPVARGLEGRWRAGLGDVIGASLAFARMREMASALAPDVLGGGGAPPLPAGGGAASRVGDERASSLSMLLDLLGEAAALENERRGDALAAQRHLAVALRLAPHDPALQRSYRAIGAAILGSAAPPPPANEPLVLQRASATHEALDGPPIVETDRSAISLVAVTDPFAESGEDADLAARAEELGRLVQADPRNEDAATELAEILEALGRGHELLALMMGRLEDAPAERRPELVVRVRAVLDRLAEASALAGRMDEAALYRTMPVE